MGRSRYKIYEPTYPYFITCTILHWIPIFTRTETTDIIFDSLKYLQKEDNLKIYSYVILENHLHMIISSNDISKSIKKFKSFTANTVFGWGDECEMKDNHWNKQFNPIKKQMI